MRLRNIPGSRDIIAVSEFVVQEPEAHKGRWSEVFGNDHPIDLEIGIGKGRFLMDLAERNPDTNYLGIEMYSSVLLRAIQKAEQRTAGLKEPLPVSAKRRPGRPANCNFRLLRLDAADLPEIFGKGEIRKIYLNFSDPWPKDRHADRRLTSGRFLRRYEEVLADEGILEFKTDNRDLFDFSLEQIRESGWKLLFHTFDLHGALQKNGDGAAAETPAEEPAETPANELAEARTENIMTEYEEKFAAEGNPICKLKAQVRGREI